MHAPVIALAAAIRHPERWRSVIVQGLPVLPGRNIPKPLEAPARAARPCVIETPMNAQTCCVVAARHPAA